VGNGGVAARVLFAGAVMTAVHTSAAPATSPRPQVQGHRGARGLRPENTLPAFAAALGIGVDALELDLGVTRDGVVVVGHDPRLRGEIVRGPDGHWITDPGPSIHELTFAELSRYDVGRLRPGTPYAAQFPDQVPVDGTRMPRLADVFALAARAGNARVRFNIEIKTEPREPALTEAPEPFADAVVAVVRAAGMAARTTIQSFDWRSLRRVRATAPEIETSCLTVQQKDEDTVEVGRRGKKPWLGDLDVNDLGGSVPRLVKAFGCAVWSPYYGDLTAPVLADARAEGVSVLVWTVNREPDMERMIDLGVLGIITDRPDLLRGVLARRGLAVPASTPVEP
jgi:glycerophosphoryl diester phosphodiesterase